MGIEARAGDPTVSFSLEAVPAPLPQDLAMEARAGDPTVSFDLEAVPADAPTELAMEARAGAPTVSFDLEAVPAATPTDIAMTARAGDPTVSFNLTAVAPPLDPPTIDTIPAHANEVVRGLITLNDFTEGDTILEEWFRIASSLGSVSADSDMLIAANLTLDRMRWRSSDQRVTFNRTGTGTISSYFGTGQPGRTQFVFIAVADSEAHIAEIDIGAEVAVAGTGTLRLDTIPAAAQALLNLVQPEGVINLVIGDEALAPTELAMEARAGDSHCLV